MSRWQVWVAGASMVSAMIWPFNAFAERYSPEINLESPSETLDTQDTWTPVEALAPPEMYSHLPLTPPALESDSPVLKGRVDLEKEFVPDIEFGSVHTLGKGEQLVLTIMDLMATGYNQAGDTFNARVKHAVERNGEVLIPKGALVKGHIEQAMEPGKSFSKNGQMILAFDYILMPDGRKVPFKSEFQKKDSSLMAMGRAVGSGLGGTLGGAIRGVLVGLRFGGVSGAMMTNGATLIGAGGLGALGGLGSGLARSGDHILLNEGDEIKVALQEPLALPVIHLPPDTVNEIHAPGLDVKITDYSLGRDPFKVENQINVAFAINNQTEYRFGSFDLALMDEYQNVYAVSPFGNDNMMIFQLQPNSQLQGQLAFSVKSPDVRHYLIFYKPYTREVLAKISLTEALKQLTRKSSSKASARGM